MRRFELSSSVDRAIVDPPKLRRPSISERKERSVSRRKFHLAWFTNFVQDEWNEPFASAGGSPWSADFFIDFAKNLERACFDYIIFEDKLMVSEAYGSSSEAYLKGGIQVPKHDPAPLVAVLASHTRHLGVVATLSTLGYPPFLLARLCTTIDHIARGRFGWNIVTSGEDAAA
jgi:alkanesulfonate monooxygenase SsuD/methylene tetrahydromethanopterin reductase-like flavin-dependent oxidoreductase (luciferase family)